LNERERQLNERERQLDERAHRVGVAVDDLQQRVLASIERSRALLARSGERLSRQEAGLKRIAEDRQRQQAEINRERSTPPARSSPTVTTPPAKNTRSC
jgi:hypothetical protein